MDSVHSRSRPSSHESMACDPSSDGHTYCMIICDGSFREDEGFWKPVTTPMTLAVVDRTFSAWKSEAGVTSAITPLSMACTAENDHGCKVRTHEVPQHARARGKPSI